MSEREWMGRQRLAGIASLPVAKELERVRQRAGARLGAGIDLRSVQIMVDKLDKDKKQ